MNITALLSLFSFIPASGFVGMGPCTLLCPGVYNADKTAVCVFNQSNISRDLSLQLSICLAESDLVVIGLTGIGPIRKISCFARGSIMLIRRPCVSVRM
jgi:hypothetical protein